MEVAHSLIGSRWFWAWGLAALGWIYCILAHLGPALFHRAVLRIATCQEDGYQVGRALYWRLSARVALLLAVISGAPLLAAGALSHGWAAIVLGLIGVAQVALWLTQPPGRCLGISALPGGAGQPPLLVLQPIDPWWRGIVMLAVCGLAPACAAAWTLSIVGIRMAH
jgi:hypothetical protein